MTGVWAVLSESQWVSDWSRDDGGMTRLDRSHAAAELRRHQRREAEKQHEADMFRQYLERRAEASRIKRARDREMMKEYELRRHG